MVPTLAELRQALVASGQLRAGYFERCSQLSHITITIIFTLYNRKGAKLGGYIDPGQCGFQQSWQLRAFVGRLPW